MSLGAIEVYVYVCERDDRGRLYVWLLVSIGYATRYLLSLPFVSEIGSPSFLL